MRISDWSSDVCSSDLVNVLPADIEASGWDARLEPDGERPAVRLGLNLVKGLSRQAAERIEAARRQQPFCSEQDLAARADLNRHEMDALAAATVLHALSGHRRLARCQPANLPLTRLRPEDRKTTRLTSSP